MFIWTPPAIAVADLIVNGVLERHPDLRVGIVELSAVWVPLFLLMIVAPGTSRPRSTAGS